MKSVFNICLAVLSVVAVALLNSCDKIDPPYKNGITTNPDTTQKLRKILLEDYTGHRCGNCPRAGKIAHDLKQLYGNRIVILSVHAGNFAKPALSGPMTYDFRSATGTELDVFFNISAGFGNPNGMINRIRYPQNAYVLPPTSWSSIADSILAVAPDVYINIENNFNASSRALTTNIKTEILKSMTGNYKLAVYLTESNIVKPQLDYDLSPNDTVYNYVHDWVLRGAINSTWGELVVAGSAAAANEIKKSYNYILPAAWQEDNCSVAAYLYNADTYEVIQAAEQKIK